MGRVIRAEICPPDEVNVVHCITAAFAAVSVRQ